ncbi:MAG: HU family DNA-binding protein [Proteobacteria bacterium]|nr:HU family DNA-binding protein [Pseudomonadota bacterium]
MAAKAAKKNVKKTASKVTVRTKKNTTPLTKGQLQTMIAEATDLSRKQVAAVMDQITNQIERSISKNAAGEFTLPGLLKVKVVRKPATKARKGINPFTGEETMFKAKPARNVVKIKPLKKLKEMVQ